MSHPEIVPDACGRSDVVAMYPGLAVLVGMAVLTEVKEAGGTVIMAEVVGYPEYVETVPTASTQ